MVLCSIPQPGCTSVSLWTLWVLLAQMESAKAPGVSRFFHGGRYSQWCKLPIQPAIFFCRFPFGNTAGQESPVMSRNVCNVPYIHAAPRRSNLLQVACFKSPPSSLVSFSFFYGLTVSLPLHSPNSHSPLSCDEPTFDPSLAYKFAQFHTPHSCTSRIIP